MLNVISGAAVTVFLVSSTSEAIFRYLQSQSSLSQISSYIPLNKSSIYQLLKLQFNRTQKNHNSSLCCEVALRFVAFSDRGLN